MREEMLSLVVRSIIVCVDLDVVVLVISSAV